MLSYISVSISYIVYVSVSLSLFYVSLCLSLYLFSIYLYNIDISLSLIYICISITFHSQMKCTFHSSELNAVKPDKYTRSDVKDCDNEPRMTVMHALPQQHASHLDIKKLYNLLGKKMLQINALSLKGEELQHRHPPQERARSGECRWR